MSRKTFQTAFELQVYMNWAGLLLGLHSYCLHTDLAVPNTEAAVPNNLPNDDFSTVCKAFADTFVVHVCFQPLEGDAYSTYIQSQTPLGSRHLIFFRQTNDQTMTWFLPLAQPHLDGSFIAMWWRLAREQCTYEEVFAANDKSHFLQDLKAILAQRWLAGRWTSSLRAMVDRLLSIYPGITLDEFTDGAEYNNFQLPSTAFKVAEAWSPDQVLVKWAEKHNPKWQDEIGEMTIDSTYQELNIQPVRKRLPEIAMIECQWILENAVEYTKIFLT